MREWSEEDFQARCEARIKQLGKSVNALFRDVGLSGDEIRKAPKRGRRIDTVIKIAQALRWTLGQAIGIHDPTLFLDRERAVDPTRLARAWSIAEQVVGDNPEGDNNATLADIASLVYSVVSEEQERAGRSLSDDEARTLIESLLRRFFKAK